MTHEHAIHRPVSFMKYFHFIVCLFILCLGGRLASAQEPAKSDKTNSKSQETEAPTDEKETTSDEKAESDSAEEEPPGEEQDETPQRPTPWILKPYRVRVYVSFETDPILTANSQQSVIARLQNHLASQFHQMWELEVTAATPETWYMPAQLAELNEEMLPVSIVSSEHDKVFLASVTHETGTYHVQAREFDASSRTLGSFHHTMSSSRRELVAHLAQMVNEAFRPIAQLEVVNEDVIEFQIRGGEFPPRNPNMQQFREGDFLVPYLRYLDRKREVQRIQMLPWTYLQVTDVGRSRIQLDITSAFGNPVAAKRRRVEIHAMRIRPYLPSTEIFIYPRGEKQNPLVGYRCEVMDRVPTDEDKVEDRLKLETDRRGIVTVPVIPKSPLQYLYVYSGQALLAKVPFIPGYSPLLEVEVPDDRARLNVEGEVSLLQGELIDIIATREVLMARTRAAAKSKKWEDVGRFLSQLQDLPTLDQYQSRIASLEVQAVQAAKLKRDRVAEIRVKRLCSNILESAEKHLDPFRIAEFRREMDELKKIQN